MLMSPIKLSHRFTCSMETCVYLLIFVYSSLIIFVKEGVIEKYVTVLNRKKLGSSIIVFLEGSLKVEKFEQADEFFEAVAATPEIIECYLLGGENDFMLKVMAPELDKYHDFYATKIASLPRVGQIKSSFVIKEIKHSMKLPNFSQWPTKVSHYKIVILICYFSKKTNNNKWIIC